MKVGDLIRCSFAGGSWNGLIVDVRGDANTALIWRPELPAPFMWMPINGHIYNLEVISECR